MKMFSNMTLWCFSGGSTAPRSGGCSSVGWSGPVSGSGNMKGEGRLLGGDEGGREWEPGDGGGRESVGT